MADLTQTLKFVLLGEDKSASKTLAGVGKNATDASVKLGGIRGAAAGIKSHLGAIGATAAGAAIIKFGSDSIKSFQGAAGETSKLQRVMGGTPEAASRMNFAIKNSGVSSATGAKSIQMLEKNLAKAALTGKGTEAMAKTLGSSFTDANGKILPMSDMMPKLADKFSKMPNGAEKTALAMKLFGKSGTEMLPFLNKGASGIAEMEAKSDKLGHTLSGPQLEAFKKNKGASRDWDATLQGLQIQVGANLLPILTDFVSMLSANLGPAIQGVSQFFHENQGIIAAVAPVIAGLAGGIAIVVGVVRAWTAVQGVLNVVLAANPIGLIVIAIAALVAGLIWAYQNVTWFRDGVNAAFKAIGDLGRWLWNNALAPALRGIVGGFAWVMDGLAGMLDGLGNIPGFEWAKTAAANLRGVAKAARDAAAGIKDIPDSTTPAVTLKDRASAEISKIDSKIKSLKGKIVEAKAKGDYKQVTTLQNKINALKSKKVDIQANVRKTGINSIKVYTVGSSTVKFSASARGAIRGRRFATGGVEDHSAKIYGPGDGLRLFNEPEAGGESYIPLANDSRRGRAVAIWRETGRLLGQYAAGGIAVASRLGGGVVADAGGVTYVTINAKVERGADPLRFAREVEAELVALKVRNRKLAFQGV